MAISPLEHERIKRGWSRAYIEAVYQIPASSLERWEKGRSRPGTANRNALCRIFDKTPEELGIDKRGRMGARTIVSTPNSQEENPVSDLIRRAVFSNLSSKLTGLIDRWPKRNYHYEELQSEMNRAVTDYNVLAGQDGISEISRREALKSVGLVPIQLCVGLDGIITLHKAQADTDTLLKHLAAGIAVCWYLRRGKELVFISDLISSYISILQPLIYSKSEGHRKAAATLLSQIFRLKAGLATHSRSLKSSAGTYYDEAVQYALMSENPTEQAIANNIRAMARHWIEEYEQALFDAEKAYGLMTKGTPKIIRSFIAAGLSQCQAASGHPEDAKNSLKEAFDLFDSTMPISSMPYSEAILTFVAANVRQHSGLWEESVNLYEKSLVIPDISALGALQCRINYATTEVSRDDIQTRDMDLCIKLLTEAITGATELDSERYKREARECYRLLCVAWPREDAIKKLGKDHFGIK